MLKLAIIAVLLLVVFYFSRKNKRLYRQVRERKAEVLDRFWSTSESDKVD